MATRGNSFKSDAAARLRKYSVSVYIPDSRDDGYIFHGILGDIGGTYVPIRAKKFRLLGSFGVLGNLTVHLEFGHFYLMKTHSGVLSRTMRNLLFSR